MGFCDGRLLARHLIGTILGVTEYNHILRRSSLGKLKNSENIVDLKYSVEKFVTQSFRERVPRTRWLPNFLSAQVFSKPDARVGVIEL
jgi:hypothetical protein